MATEFLTIKMTNDGEGATTVDLTDVFVRLITKFNYSAQCWVMDIQDIDNNLLVAGLMLVPNVDILIPYRVLKELIGALVLVELNTGDYRSDDLLGYNTVLLWYPVGTTVELPA